MYHRILSEDFKRLVSQYPVITLTGPRQSGKTTLCRHLFQNYDYRSLEDLSTREYALSDPISFLDQFKNGVILDEIQRAPNLVSYIQTRVDNHQRSGEFILTGSQQFEVTNTINQSLAGRTAVLKLLPLAYSELYDINAKPTIAEIIYSGFYPRIHDKNLNPTEALGFYLSTYVERDIRNLMNIKNLAIFERFLKICATQIGQLVNYSHLANDCGITVNTVKEWLSLLEASYIIFLLQPHFNNFRKRLTKSPKLFFYDVGLASYLLGITDIAHVQTHPLRGMLFENFVISEFLKNRYNHVKNNNLYFYRDQAGNEVDLILDYGQDLVPIEIKVGTTISNNYFKGLNYYQHLSAQNQKGYVIYSGHESLQYRDAKIYSYIDLPLVYEDLKVTFE